MRHSERRRRKLHTDALPHALDSIIRGGTVRGPQDKDGEAKLSDPRGRPRNSVSVAHARVMPSRLLQMLVSLGRLTFSGANWSNQSCCCVSLTVWRRVFNILLRHDGFALLYDNKQNSTYIVCARRSLYAYVSSTDRCAQLLLQLPVNMFLYLYIKLPPEH